MVFDQFERLGTIRKVLRYLLANDIRIGIRPHAGPNRGQLEWRLPTRDTVADILHHPIYAGYYCFGRQADRPAAEEARAAVVGAGRGPARRIPGPDPGQGARRTSPGISTTPTSGGSPRTGPGSSPRGHRGRGRRCWPGSSSAAGVGSGWPSTTPAGRRSSATRAGPGWRDARGTCRHALAGRVLDQFIADQVLAALRPGALELSLAAADDVMRERSALDENWRQRLERARTQAARIERQYQAAEPENRLVQRTLERRWEEALQEVRRLEEEYARFRQTQPTTLTRQEVDQIRELARDLPALWDAPTTTPADRQQVIRFLVERVEVQSRGSVIGSG